MKFVDPYKEEYVKNAHEASGVSRIACLLIAIILFVMVAALCSSCASTKKVKAETVVKIDTCYISKVSVDTVWQKDSSFVSFVERNDTVWVTEYRDRVEYKVKVKEDTVWKERVDTVMVEQRGNASLNGTEQEMSWWQKVKMEIGGYVIGALLVILVFVVWKLIKK